MKDRVHRRLPDDREDSCYIVISRYENRGVNSRRFKGRMTHEEQEGIIVYGGVNDAHCEL